MSAKLSAALIGLALRLVCGNVLLKDTRNTTVWEAPDLPARFGPPIPDDGIWGNLLDVHTNGCNLTAFPEAPRHTSYQWIALIKRGLCQFDLKVLNAQRKRYVAAVVYNDESDELIPMGFGDHGQDVIISSVFIGKGDAAKFRQYLDPARCRLVLTPGSVFPPVINPTIYLFPFFIVVGLCSVVMLMFMGVRWFRDFRRRRRSRLSTANLKKIPIKKYKKGDQYDVCAICLDDFETGDKLRVLPCSHAYHQKCIDPWLTKNKKTCPICKRKVIPGDDNSSDSDEDSDDGNFTNSEDTPLLGARRGSPRQARGGGTFDNSGLPDPVRNQVNPLSLSDSSDSEYSYSTYTSNYHSSVDVHASSNQAAGPHTSHNDGDSASDVESDDELIADVPRPPAGGVENPALIVIADHFSDSVDQARPLPAASDDDSNPVAYRPLSEENGAIPVAMDTASSSRRADQIV